MGHSSRTKAFGELPTFSRWRLLWLRLLCRLGIIQESIHMDVSLGRDGASVVKVAAWRGVFYITDIKTLGGDNETGASHI